MCTLWKFSGCRENAWGFTLQGFSENQQGRRAGFEKSTAGLRPGAWGLQPLSPSPWARSALLTLRPGRLLILGCWACPLVPRQLTSLALLQRPSSLWPLSVPDLCHLSRGSPQLHQPHGHPSAVKDLCIQESGPRCSSAPGGSWQQGPGSSSLTCEHRRGQDPGEEQQRHAQGQRERHPGPSACGQRAGCTED